MKNSKYIYEVELEQITPYVNEIDGEGKDILRPTEFKPRFDRFLAGKYKEKDIEKFLLESNGEKRKAFDYNVTIKTREKYEDRKEYRIFMTAGGKKVGGYKARKENIKLEIFFFSLNSEMIKLIKENLPEFLATTNFGKRKNKCFGSFYISKNDLSYKDIDEIEALKDYKFFKTDAENKEYLKLKGNDVEKILEDLEFNTKIKDRISKKALILLRIDIDRKESLGAMKILKTKNNDYRLYFIPNLDLIKALTKEDKIYETKKTNERVQYIGDPTYKPEVFDYKEFNKYIEQQMKGE